MPRFPLLLILGLAACTPSEQGLVGRDLGGQLPAPVQGLTLVRFWTDGCPHCALTLPAIEALRLELAPRGLETLAIYHPKPPRMVTLEQARPLAAELGYQGPLAIDPGWVHLQSIRPQAGRSAPTSYSMLLDGEGVVRWFHPGPRMFPSADPQDQEADRAWSGLLAAIEEVLGE